MRTINNFCEELKKKYPNTKEVLEQIEELRDTLHLKVDENQSKGLKYEEAVKEAIDSLENIDELFENMITNTKTIYIEKLKAASISLSLIITLSITIIIAILSYYIKILSGIRLTFSEGFIGLGVSFLVLSIVYISGFVNFKNKKEAVKLNYLDYVKELRFSIICCTLISVLVIIINFITSIEYIWFVWPIIGLLNWPLALIFHYLFFKKNIFDADN